MPLEITEAHSQYLVSWDGLWGRGESLEAAQRNRLPHFLPNERLPKMPNSALVWKTTPQTRINENGSIVHPKDTAAPVRLNTKTLKPMGAK